MVEAVIQYKTFDGKAFADEDRAKQWERDIDKVHAIESMFPNNNHLSYGDYYRLPMQLIADGRRKLADALRGRYPDDVIDAFVNNTSNILGRYLDDSGSPYNAAYWLFQCIDDQGRMFNQPYYAYDADRAENEVGY